MLLRQTFSVKSMPYISQLSFLKLINMAQLQRMLAKGVSVGQKGNTDRSKQTVGP